MANLELSKIRLSGHGWPNNGSDKYGIPTDGWDNTVENFNSSDVTTQVLNPPQPIGQMRTLYSDATAAPGYYTMAYLAYHSFESAGISADFSDGQMFCAAYEGSDSVHSDTSTTPWYVMTNEFTAINSDVTDGGRIAIPCSTSIGSDGTGVVAAGKGDGWGWFWVEGVCPLNDVTLFQGTVGSLNGADITVTTTTRLGALMAEVTAGDIVLSSADASNANDATTGITNIVPQTVAYADMSGV